jgi:hypothetical protein
LYRWSNERTIECTNHGEQVRDLLERLETLGEIADTDDQGFGGKSFEKTFVKALRLAGLKFDANVESGPGWDIHTIGSEWLKLISDKDVNIKVAGTKWMVSSSEIAKVVPWDSLPTDYDRKAMEAKVRQIINSKGLPQIYFLKPKSEEIQGKIVDATNAKDVDHIKKLLVKKNFRYEKLGRNFDVKILDNGERVTSVVIMKGNKAFMRSERPRTTGRSATVAFRSRTPVISKKERAVAKTASDKN